MHVKRQVPSVAPKLSFVIDPGGVIELDLLQRQLARGHAGPVNVKTALLRRQKSLLSNHSHELFYLSNKMYFRSLRGERKRELPRFA